MTDDRAMLEVEKQRTCVYVRSLNATGSAADTMCLYESTDGEFWNIVETRPCAVPVSAHMAQTYPIPEEWQPCRIAWGWRHG